MCEWSAFDCKWPKRHEDKPIIDNTLPALAMSIDGERGGAFAHGDFIGLNTLPALIIRQAISHCG